MHDEERGGKKARMRHRWMRVFEIVDKANEYVKKKNSIIQGEAGF